MLKYKLDIVYQDKDVIVVNKPSNLLTIATDNCKENNLYHYVSMYLKTQNKKNKVFIVHRLDKQTSGLIIFAKSYSVKLKLQKLFEEGKPIRKYICITTSKPNKDEDTIINYLKEDKFGNVFLSNKDNKYAKKAVTQYKVVSKVKNGYLLDVNILTGRKNQIRVALASINCPILGDKKYSTTKSKIMYLKAYLLDLTSYNSVYLFKINSNF